MNPWGIIWAVLGWSVLAAIVCLILVVIAGAIYGLVDHWRKPKRKKGATQIYSSDHDV